MYTGFKNLVSKKWFQKNGIVLLMTIFNSLYGSIASNGLVQLEWSMYYEDIRNRDYISTYKDRNRWFQKNGFKQKWFLLYSYNIFYGYIRNDGIY